MKFRRKKKSADSTALDSSEDQAASEPTEDAADESQEVAEATEDLIDFDRSNGPFDASELADDDERIDLGGVQIPLVDDLEIRVEMDQNSQRPTAVTLISGQGAVQIRPFSAPRSGGLWKEAREEIKAEIAGNGGQVEEVTGVFGKELQANMASKDADGKSVTQPIRFVAIEGPRWMLQGIFFGEGVDPKTADTLDDIYRSVVVVRGEGPMPAKQALAITMPENVSADVEESDSEQVDGDFRPPGLSSSSDPGIINGQEGLLAEDDEDDASWIDLGSLQIPGYDGLEIRVEVDEESREPIAVTLIFGEGAVQVRPFSAPSTGSLWDEARSEIKADITRDGGLIDESDGPFGKELRAQVSAEDENGEPFIQPIRFVGLAGEGWMLQGVFLGEGTNPEAAGDLEEIFSSIAVVTSPETVPPGHPLPIILPDGVPPADS